MMVDAKCKLDAKQGDLYQVVAYCHAPGLTQAGRRHPGEAGGKLVVATGQRPQDGQRVRG